MALDEGLLAAKDLEDEAAALQALADRLSAWLNLVTPSSGTGSWSSGAIESSQEASDRPQHGGPIWGVAILPPRCTAQSASSVDRLCKI